jgi:hypothetical protein
LTLVIICLLLLLCKTKLKKLELMVDKMKFEVVILICALLIGWACQTLVITRLLSPMTLYGCVFGTIFLLFVMGLFSFLSIHGISEDKESRRDAALFYGFLAIVASISMLMLILFEVNNIICWIVACVLWCLACTIRNVKFWSWF